MMKPRWVTALLVVGLLLAACGSAGQEPAQELAAGATQEVVLEADILPAPSNTPPAAEPAEATEDGSESAAETPTAPSAEPAPAEPSPTEEPQPTATAAPQFNGEYEGTYYRGLATAPITMIDYSDFL